MIVLLAHDVQISQVLIRRSVVGTQADGLLELKLGPVQLSALEVEVSQIVVNVC